MIVIGVAPNKKKRPKMSLQCRAPLQNETNAFEHTSFSNLLQQLLSKTCHSSRQLPNTWKQSIFSLLGGLPSTSGAWREAAASYVRFRDIYRKIIKCRELWGAFIWYFTKRTFRHRGTYGGTPSSARRAIESAFSGAQFTRATSKSKIDWSNEIP